MAEERTREEYEKSPTVKGIRDAQVDGGDIDRLILESETDKKRAELKKQGVEEHVIDLEVDSLVESIVSQREGSIRHVRHKPNTYRLRNPARCAAIAFCR